MGALRARGSVRSAAEGRARPALANLERIDYLGLTERFDEFLALVALGLTDDRTAALPRGEVRRRGRPEVRAPRNGREPARPELYARAEELVEKAAVTAGAALSDDLAVMRGEPAAETGRSLPFDARVELARKERDLVLMDNEVRQLKRKLKPRRERARQRRGKGRWRLAQSVQHLLGVFRGLYLP